MGSQHLCAAPRSRAGSSVRHPDPALLSGPAPLVQIADTCGFASQSHFTRAFKAATSTTPAGWRRAVKDGPYYT
ncbi:helix-turn-helix domain-containing protein [Rhodovulum sulfidophilum]|uniref:helix-turn-helix domain-containing protein n=1 Tax=Rhodovulum sulfidophilum TaxID=35806 RepID=UPI001921B83D|nr:helix-turn-helix transcriptional regulator [Rhodovulum sulfidophilum]